MGYRCLGIYNGMPSGKRNVAGWEIPRRKRHLDGKIHLEMVFPLPCLITRGYIIYFTANQQAKRLCKVDASMAKCSPWCPFL